MSKITCDMAMSVDGFVAGLNQSLENPFGEDVGQRLHRWMFDEPKAHAAVIEGITAAGRSSWVATCSAPAVAPGTWTGRAGGGTSRRNHGPVFVLTHHPRQPLPMKGGTTFTFVTDGIEAALAQAREAAGDRHVAIAGGAQTANQYLAAGLIDELRPHVAPVILGRGERLFDGVGNTTLEPLGDVSSTGLVMHLTYRVIR